jgi:hypothetical protein
MHFYKAARIGVKKFSLINKWNMNENKKKLHFMGGGGILSSFRDLDVKFEATQKHIKGQKVIDININWLCPREEFLQFFEKKNQKQKSRDTVLLSKIFLKNSFWTHFPSTMFWQCILNPPKISSFQTVFLFTAGPNT